MPIYIFKCIWVETSLLQLIYIILLLMLKISTIREVAQKVHMRL